MDKSEKILELKIKLVELQIERDKDIHAMAVSVIVGVITFVITTEYLAKLFNDTLKKIAEWALSIHPLVAVILFLVLLIVLPLLAGYIANKAIQLVMKSKAKVYNDGIREINQLLEELHSKKD
jgi:hypothetical protein